MDIKTTDTKELKAMAYDTLAQIEQLQRNLRALNDEIYRRNTSSQPLAPVNAETNQEATAA